MQSKTIRLLETLIAIVSVIVLLLSAAFYGINHYLSQGADAKLKAVMERFIPNTEFNFGSVEVLVSWNKTHIKVTNLHINDSQGNAISIPTAKFWWDGNEVVGDLQNPSINIRSQQSVGALSPLFGEWAIDAYNAKINFTDSNISLTIDDAAFNIRSADNTVRMDLYGVVHSQQFSNLPAPFNQILKSQKVKIQTQTSINDGVPIADIYAEIKDDNASRTPKNLTNALSWSDSKITARINLQGKNINYEIGGNINRPHHAVATADELSWYASGTWQREQTHLSVIAQVSQLHSTILPDALPTDSYIEGKIKIAHNGTWQWHSENIIARNAEGNITATLSISGDTNAIKDYEMIMHLANVSNNGLWRYIQEPQVQQWFKESLREGMINRAALSLHSVPTTDTPTIALTATFAQGNIWISDEWPDAQQLRGALSYRDNEILIVGDGSIASSYSPSITVHISDLTAQKSTLYLNALFTTMSLTNYMAAAKQLPPAASAIEDINTRLSIAGEGQLSLSVNVPLATPTDSVFHGQLSIVHGEVNRIQSEESESVTLPPLQQLSGIININNHGSIGNLNGFFLEEPAVINFVNENITMHSKIAISNAISLAGLDELASQVSGTVNFELQGYPSMTIISSPLLSAHINLPQPLQKAIDIPASLTLHLNADSISVALFLDNNVFRAVNNHNDLSSSNWDIAINAESLPPPTNGINLHGKIANIQNANLWLNYVEENQNTSQVAISILLTDFHLFGTNHQRLEIIVPTVTTLAQSNINTDNNTTTRLIILNGDKIAGTLHYAPNNLHAHLSHLYLSEFSDSDSMWDMSVLSLDFQVDDFWYTDISLGALSLSGAPAPSPSGDWQLNNFILQDDNRNTLEIAGKYSDGRTELVLHLYVPDAPFLLNTFGIDGLISEGSADIEGRISWPHSPIDFSIAQATANIRVNANDLRYLKSDENDVVSFLAVFSPLSLLRLGFTEIGKDGLRLLILNGEVVLGDNHLKIEEINMANEDLHISLEGAADIEKRLLDLSGRVRPGNRLLNAGISIGAGIATVQPLSLAAGIFLGKVFQKPLSEIGAYNYTITGTWDEPVYTEVGVTPRQLPQQ